MYTVKTEARHRLAALTGTIKGHILLALRRARHRLAAYTGTRHRLATHTGARDRLGRQSVLNGFKIYQMKHHISISSLLCLTNFG